MTKKIYTMSLLHIINAILFSFVLAVLSSIFISINWPATELERMAAAGLFFPVIWLTGLFVGLLLKNNRHVLGWLAGSSLLLLIIIFLTY